MKIADIACLLIEFTRVTPEEPTFLSQTQPQPTHEVSMCRRIQLSSARLDRKRNWTLRDYRHADSSCHNSIASCSQKTKKQESKPSEGGDVTRSRTSHDRILQQVYFISCLKRLIELSSTSKVCDFCFMFAFVQVNKQAYGNSSHYY